VFSLHKKLRKLQARCVSCASLRSFRLEGQAQIIVNDICLYIKKEFLAKVNGTFKWMEDNHDGCKDDYLAKK